MPQANHLYPQHPVLMVDDELPWLRSMGMSLKSVGGITNVQFCNDSREVAELLKNNVYSLVILDLTMPYINGEELLNNIGENYPELPVIIISGMNQIETAIRCVRAGAEDFYVKTDEPGKNYYRHSKGPGNRYGYNKRFASCQRPILDSDPATDPAFSGIVSKNIKMHSIFTYLKAIAGSMEPILITGESGTGKELIAQAVHQLSAPDKPLVAVNVAGLDDMMFSDSLFGHVKGAFTGADKIRLGMI